MKVNNVPVLDSNSVHYATAIVDALRLHADVRATIVMSDNAHWVERHLAFAVRQRSIEITDRLADLYSPHYTVAFDFGPSPTTHVWAQGKDMPVVELSEIDDKIHSNTLADWPRNEQPDGYNRVTASMHYLHAMRQAWQTGRCTRKQLKAAVRVVAGEWPEIARRYSYPRSFAPTIHILPPPMAWGSDIVRYWRGRYHETA